MVSVFHRFLIVVIVESTYDETRDVKSDRETATSLDHVGISQVQCRAGKRGSCSEFRSFSKWFMVAHPRFLP